MKKVYVRGDKVVAVGWITPNAPATITPSDSGVVVFDMDAASLVDVGWAMSEGKGGLEFKAPAPSPPTIGPNEFHFLWTMAEQVAIEELRSADPVVKLFMRRLDDPRTTEVVLADPAVQAAVRHTVAQLVAKGEIEEADAEARAAAIIAGPKK